MIAHPTITSPTASCGAPGDVENDERTITYDYTNNRLTQINDTITTTLSYDDLGNMTKIKTGADSTTYEYNDAGQLVSVDNGATAQYFYDGRGRRIKVLNGSSGRYVYYDKFGRIISEFRTEFSKWDRDFIYLNGKIIAELEQHYDQNIKSAGAESGGIEPPPPLPLPGLIDIFYFHTDHLGTPIAMTDEQSNVAWTARYYPFGELYYEWVVAKNHIRFPGQWQDDETDLYYNWHRYYDPATGRYMQADPIGLAGGMNLYAYVANNPVGFSDPEGLFGWKDLFFTDVTQFDAKEFVQWAYSPAMYNINQLQGYLLSLLPASVRKGVFTDYGEEALDFWRNKYDQKCNSWYEDAFYGLSGWAAALWTPETWMGTAATLVSARPLGRLGGVPRSYWQYYPKGNMKYSSEWIAPSTNLRPPYGTGLPARQALNLPHYNPATAVRRVPIRWWQPMRIPRHPGPQPDWGWPTAGSGYETQAGGLLWPRP